MFKSYKKLIFVLLSLASKEVIIDTKICNFLLPPARFSQLNIFSSFTNFFSRSYALLWIRIEFSDNDSTRLTREKN